MTRTFDSNLNELPARNPGRRYRHKRHPVTLEHVDIEFSPAEEAARDAEEALPPPPFSGLGFCRARRLNQGIPNSNPTPIQFTQELVDRGDYLDLAQPAVLTVGPAQEGVFALVVSARFDEATAGAGGTANAGDRALRIRVNGAAAVSQRQRAATGGDTELTAAAELDLVAGDSVRVIVEQNCGGTMQCDARVALRRLSS